MKIYNKYKIEHTDGTPLKGKKYFVLRLDSDDPIEAARVARAMRAYEGKPRNCDVGTDAEQAQRFERFCAAHHEEWKNGRPLMAWTCDCPCYQTGKNSCNYFTWAQMPYDAEAEGAK